MQYEEIANAAAPAEEETSSDDDGLDMIEVVESFDDLPDVTNGEEDLDEDLE